MTMCNGGDHALRAAPGHSGDQRRVGFGLRNRLRHHLVSCPHIPSITTASITDIDAPGLNLRDLDFKSRLFRLLAQRFPEAISRRSTAGSQVLSPRIEQVGSSSTDILPSELFLH